MKNLVGYDEKTRRINVAFDKIFEREDISHMNVFIINKRAYYGLLDLISEDLNLIINNYDEFAFSLLEIKYNLSINRESYNYMDFYKDIERLFLNDEKLKETISKIVEDEYTLNLNEVSNSKKINIELQITDELNKVFLKSSILMRALIPVLCDYEGNDDALEAMMTDLFEEILRLFDVSDRKEAATNKLYKIIYSRVSRTKYSDQVIWGYIKNMSKDPTIIVKQNFNHIIKKIMPKIKHNSSFISFLDSVLKNRIEFMFKYDYKTNYKPLRADTEDDGDLSEQEKLEINLLRSDEGSIIINECTIRQEIQKIKKKYNLKKKDIMEFVDGRDLNSVQTHLARIYYSNKLKIGSKKEDIFYLIYGMVKDLESMNFSILPKILKSNVASNVKKITNKRKLVERVVMSEKYSDLLKDYKPVESLLDKNNSILALMSIRNYKFIDKEEREIEIPLDLLAEELLDLLFLP
ncbi:hypothetical protein Bp8pS_281 [Bacillus phage vB_BpuM-BpSp]|nr:hypothetical protein Bp8pS_281 [Bacillus phage vB_BpuM-BpSp]